MNTNDPYIKTLKKFVADKQYKYKNDFGELEKKAQKEGMAVNDYLEKVNFMATCGLACELKIADLEKLLSILKENLKEKESLTEKEEYLLNLDIVLTAYKIVNCFSFDDVIAILEAAENGPQTKQPI